MPSPLWLRAVLTVDRLFSAVATAETALRDELLTAFLPPAQREAFAQHAYSRKGAKVVNAAAGRAPLFSWEERLLALPDVPRGGHLLLGGAGAGRELGALLQRGYSALVFEPSTLWTAAREVAASSPSTTVVQASYADLVDAVQRGTGPLAAPLRERANDAPFDAVLLGWDSLSHVLDASARHALLTSLRRLAPRAPVLASFMVRARTAESPRVQRMRRVLRRVFALAGAGAGEVPPGLRFYPTIGFVHLFTREEVGELAAGAGYRVAFHDVSPCGQVLLLPI